MDFGGSTKVGTADAVLFDRDLVFNAGLSNIDNFEAVFVLGLGGV